MFGFNKKEWLIVIVVALGYFVDLYDIMLFSIVRTASLKGIGIVDPDQLKNIGLSLLNWQLFGMLLGGVVWGILADKKGRKGILFGSIIMYSLATFTNAFVTNVNQYTILRFFAGFGLAGELGVGIALVSETVRDNLRTIATTIVASFGMLGGVVAALVATKMDWQTSYIVGGSIGLILLIFRFNVVDSELFEKVRNTSIDRGNFLRILREPKLAKKYLSSMLVGAPTYVFAGIFITLAPEYGIELGLFNEINGQKEPMVSAATAVIYLYSTLTLFDALSGLMSKLLVSRKKVLYIFLSLQFITVFVFLYLPTNTLNTFYWKCGLIGASLGFWTIFVTNATEQFGTNLRATVSSSIPNFARAIAIPFIILFQTISPSLGIITAGAIVAISTILIAFVATTKLFDRFEKNLAFTE